MKATGTTTTAAPTGAPPRAAAGGPPRPVRLLFTGHDFKFLTPLMDHCRAAGRYEVAVDEHQGHCPTDTGPWERLVRRADLVFCEWCLGNAVWFSRNKRPGQRLVVRLHLQEMDLPLLDEVAWERVDALVAICPWNRDRLLERFPAMRDRTHLIYNPIDCGPFDQPKLPGAEFNLGYIGMVPQRKRLDLAVEILHRLRAVDRRYTLFVKGRRAEDYPWMLQRYGEMAWYRHVYDAIDRSEHRHAIAFDPQGNDVPDWFTKVGTLLSTSDFEGSHQAVAEGMASGALPAIRDWNGAAMLYPPRFVWHDVDEAVEQILRRRDGGPHAYTDETAACRRFAREHFDAPVICRQYDALFDALLDRAGQRTGPSAPATTRRDRESERPTALHVCYLKLDARHGYRTRVVEETRHLAGLGHRVALAVFTPAQDAPTEAQCGRFAEQFQRETGAAVTVLPTPHFFDLELSAAARASMVEPLVRLARHHGARVLHGQALYAARVALEAARQADAACVFDCHGIVPEETAMSGGHPKRVAALERIERDLLERCDLAVLVSQRMRRHFRDKYGVALDRTLEVPCCVRLDNFAADSAAARAERARLGVGDRPVLAYVGTLTAWQWPEAMFTLFAQLHRRLADPYLLLLLPEGDHERAAAMLDGLGVPRAAWSVRAVPHEQVGAALAAADAGLLLRQEDPVNHVSSPTKFGEYLAVGVPVITTPATGDFAGWVERDRLGALVRPGGDGLDPAALDALARRIDEIRADRDGWRARCRRVVAERLSWPSRAAMLSEAYGALLRAAPGRV